jgi:hypothetical protein
LSEIATEDGILTSAFKSRVPVFCPAITDSAFGVAIGISRIEKKNQFQFDVIQDVVDMAQIVSKSRSTGVVYFAGGVAKSFIQQSETAAAMLHNTVRGHKFAVQVVTESADYGQERPLDHGAMRRHHRHAHAGNITLPNRLESHADSQAHPIQLRQRPDHFYAVTCPTCHGSSCSY